MNFYELYFFLNFLNFFELHSKCFELHNYNAKHYTKLLDCNGLRQTITDSQEPEVVTYFVAALASFFDLSRFFFAVNSNAYNRRRKTVSYLTTKFCLRRYEKNFFIHFLFFLVRFPRLFYAFPHSTLKGLITGSSSPKFWRGIAPSAPSSPSPFSPFSETEKIRTSYRPTFEICH